MSNAHAHSPHLPAGRDTARDRMIADAYACGDSLRVIGSALGISHERVRQLLVRQGIALRPRYCPHNRARFASIADDKHTPVAPAHKREDVIGPDSSK